MKHPKLISGFPPEASITDRILLVDPALFPLLTGRSISECRIFLFVAEGYLTIEKNRRKQIVQANQLIDILAWEPITFVSVSNDIEAWCLMPNYIFTNESLNGMRPEDSEPFKDRHSIPLIDLTQEETSVVRRQFSLLRDALADMSNFYRVELCRCYFRSFMLEMGNIVLHRRNADEKSTRIDNRQDLIVRNFLKLMWKHYRTHHSLSFYAEQLCLSEKHFTRVVKERLGKTPHAVLRDELLQRATYLLEDTKVAIQDIAADLHFSETAAFCKFFKKHKGVSPTAFRSKSKSVKRTDVNSI